MSTIFAFLLVPGFTIDHGEHVLWALALWHMSQYASVGGGDPTIVEVSEFLKIVNGL